MGKDRRTHGRKRRKGESVKRAERKLARKESLGKRDDGAGARDLSVPDRHHRR